MGMLFAVSSGLLCDFLLEFLFLVSAKLDPSRVIGFGISF